MKIISNFVLSPAKINFSSVSIKRKPNNSSQSSEHINNAQKELQIEKIKKKY